MLYRLSYSHRRQVVQTHLIQTMIITIAAPVRVSSLPRFCREFDIIAALSGGTMRRLILFLFSSS